MQAIGFETSLPIADERSLFAFEAAMPTIAAHEVLVKIAAIAVNPIDIKVRNFGAPPAGETRILGWDAAGVITEVGKDVSGFQVGDEVYYAGVVNRAGCNAEYQAVDARIIAKKPHSLDFAQAAALPLTSMTAYEGLFDRLQVNVSSNMRNRVLLVIGGSGGVGSQIIQLAKQLSDLTVVATASRPESQAWCQELGADVVIDHRNNLLEEWQKTGLPAPSWVFSTQHTDDYAEQLAALMAPQGKLVMIDEPENLKLTWFKAKSISLNWESMFTRGMFVTADIQRQHEILTEVAALIDAGKIKTTLNKVISPINVANLKQAHSDIESGKSIGKIVLQGW
ncbi:zinc-binding alcohol dehydrogenase family protein [Vitreoscilla massiliensis]|uniref:Zinc-type alcohol dehydrogenase-like protein n=1 Tax=Vitreoscilla massiliensis TaxID=1689272 RepID=A0ABY4E4I4_9NEIS|nr:zinc-binding alcohol dehydrogenase family protein [Vitreoscilla massiliensis]UOO90652.1 zinc-binding alcohol dehydrogenase family protein [Vitreoscilla massiliensis]